MTPADAAPATPSRPWSGEGAWRNRSRLVRWHRLWRTRNPVTFNEKVRYKLMRDHRPLQVTFADKRLMRQYVAQEVGAEYLPRLLGQFDDAGSLLTADLPREFVLKPTHGSGACVIVSDIAPAGARLPDAQWGWVYACVRPEHATRETLAAIAQGWLAKRYGRGPNHEWAYGHASRALVVEELLRGADDGQPADHKLFVFHGHCRFLQVDQDRFGRHTTTFLDRSGQVLSLAGGHPVGNTRPAPDRLPDLIALAERLGSRTDFVRVDLYCLPDRIVVGELTSSPAGGDSPFEPESWNAEFGRTWTVPRRYR